MAYIPSQTAFKPRRLISSKMLALSMMLGALSPTHAAKAGIIEFDPPGSIETDPTAINEKGVIAGYYFDERYRQYSFLRAADGSIQTFKVSGAHGGTQAQAINKKGVVAGSICRVKRTCPGGDQGFVRATDGIITTFDAPQSISTNATTINDTGTIAGWFDPEKSGATAFTRLPSGAFTVFGVGDYLTLPASINSSGAVAGDYEEESGARHGFVRDEDGNITTFDVPGGTQTTPTCMNSSGVIAGTFDNGDNEEGFIRGADGAITTFIVEHATYTEVYGINTEGVVVGGYGSGELNHGFIRAADGTYTTFDATKGSVSTEAVAINAKGAVTGSADDGTQRRHGFLRRP